MPQSTNKHSRKMHFGRYDYAAFSSLLSYSAGSVAVPVALVNIASDLGFPLDQGGFTEGGLLHIARTAPMVLTMLLCGFVAGRIGNRKSLGYSVAAISLGLAACAIAPSYGILFLAFAFLGLGEGVLEGIATPFVQNLHENDQPGRYINFTHSFWSIGVFITVIVSGYLLSIGVSWRHILLGISLLCLIPAAMLFLPAPKDKQYPESPEPYDTKTVFNHGKTLCKIPRFWLYFAAMFLAGGGEFCLTFWTASYTQLNFKTTALAGGLAATCFAAGMILGRTGWGYLIKQHQLKQLITYSARCRYPHHTHPPLHHLPLPHHVPALPLRPRLRSILALHPKLCRRSPPRHKRHHDLHPSLMLRRPRLRLLHIPHGLHRQLLRLPHIRLLHHPHMLHPPHHPHRLRLAHPHPQNLTPHRNYPRTCPNQTNPYPFPSLHFCTFIAAYSHPLHPSSFIIPS